MDQKPKKSVDRMIELKLKMGIVNRLEEIDFIKSQIKSEITAQRLIQKGKVLSKKERLQCYSSFLNGVFCTAESPTLKVAKLVNEYRATNIITNDIHTKALKQLGKDPTIFDNSDDLAKNDIKLCIVCHAKPRSMVVIDCYHFCLCDECGGDNIGKVNKKCPICGNHFIAIKKIF